MPARDQSRRGTALLQPLAVYVFGLVALTFGAPLEAWVEPELARLAIVLAFNGAIYIFVRPALAAAPKVWATLVCGGLGLLIAAPSALGDEVVGLTAVAIALVIVGAVWEELLFRGLAFDFATARHGRWGALVLSSVCFAAAHLLDAAATEPLALAYLLLAGTVLGAVRLATGSIWPPAVLHVAHNLVLSSSAAEQTHPGSVLLAGLASVLVVAWVHRRRVAPSPSS